MLNAVIIEKESNATYSSKMKTGKSFSWKDLRSTEARRLSRGIFVGFYLHNSSAYITYLRTCYPFHLSTKSSSQRQMSSVFFGCKIKKNVFNYWVLH